ncbi:MAG: glycine cleavage system aminomethyltransferase GcvT [Ilumatobacteraceae bacterium]
MRTSPLDARHRSLGAKMVPFGGWEMPLSYEHGTVAEHLSCRSDAVVFDVSHLGTVRVSGASAKHDLQRAFTNDLDKIAPGRAQYTHLLDVDASVLDDIIVWWIDEETFDVMPNASNTSRVIDAISGHDTTDSRAVLAVQGPQARQRVHTFSADAAAVPRFAVRRVEMFGTQCVVAGTGYTGEDGIEIAAPVGVAEQVFDALLAAGVTPAGLGARDTLRLEAGLPLHGHELGVGFSPLHAGLGWVVAWNKPDFRGKAALEAIRDAGLTKRLVGISTQGRRPPREGCVVAHAGCEIGITTSGNFSPTLNHGIAFAFVDPKHVEPGTAVTIDVRGTDLPGVIVTTPFVKKQKN